MGKKKVKKMLKIFPTVTPLITKPHMNLVSCHRIVVHSVFEFYVYSNKSNTIKNGYKNNTCHAAHACIYQVSCVPQE